MGETIDGAVVDTSQRATGQGAKHGAQSAGRASGVASGDAQDAGRDGGDTKRDGRVGSVLASATGKTKERDDKGRFLPGHSFATLGGQAAGAARPIVQAIEANYPPSSIVNMIDETWGVAVSQRSPRSMLGVLELILNYTVGKPTQRSFTVKAKAEDILSRFEALAQQNTSE